MPVNDSKLDETLNITPTKVEVDESAVAVGVDREKPDRLTKTDVEKDYDYTRANLYSLIEKGQESLNGILELAGESASPRAYEVAGQIIKSVADTTDKLMELQKKVKEIDEESAKKPSTVTNNALFVGSTSELSKMLKDGFLDKK